MSHYWNNFYQDPEIISYYPSPNCGPNYLTVMEAKRASMIAKLEQRYKKTSPEITSSSNGTPNHQNGTGDSLSDFQRLFYGHHSLIAEEIGDLRNEINFADSTAGERKIDDLVGQLSRLQSLLNESTSVLSAYEIRKAGASLLELQEKLKLIRSEIQPKKRFAFTNIRPTAKKSPIPSNGVTSNGNSDSVDGIGHAPAPTATPIMSAAVVIQGQKNRDNLTLTEIECQGKDILLLDCESCTIRLLGIATTVHAKQLTNCTILSYPISTSIFIEECQRSVFVAACQQLRMHSSVDCDLYLHVTTRAIIEDCRRLRFAPCADSVDDNVADLLEKANLDHASNNWDRVQDFNWLVADQPSPNWTILPSQDRRQFRIRTFSD